MGSFLTGATGTGNNFAAQSADIKGQNFQDLLNTSQGQFNGAFNDQGNLANILMNQVNGNGPNPAQIQAQQMNENAIKSNTGMIASQKGISPAIAARLAANNAAGMQQQAAGQGALLGANQQLSAESALGGLYGQQANEAAGMDSTNQNAIASYNNAQVGMTSNMNNTNQATHAQNAATAGGLVGGLAGGISGAIGLAKGGVVPAKENPKLAMVPKTQRFDMGGPVMSNWGYSMHPNIDSGASSMANQYIAAGGQALSKGISGLLNPAAKPEGPTTTGTAAPWEEGGGMAGGPMDAMGGAGAAEGGAGLGDLAVLAAAKGGVIPEKMAGGGIMGDVMKVAPLALMALNQGGKVEDHMHHMAQIYHPDFGGKLATLKADGGNVPGKPAVAGKKNTYKNDTVPAMLSPGEIVLPRSVTQSKDPVKAAADFVAEKLRSKKQGSGNHTTDFHDALKKAIGQRRSK